MSFDTEKTECKATSLKRTNDPCSSESECYSGVCIDGFCDDNVEITQLTTELKVATNRIQTTVKKVTTQIPILAKLVTTQKSTTKKLMTTLGDIF